MLHLYPFLVAGAAVVLLTIALRYRHRAPLPKILPVGVALLAAGQLWQIAIHVLGAEYLQQILERVSDSARPPETPERIVGSAIYGTEVGPLFWLLDDLFTHLRLVGLLLFASGLFVHTRRLVRKQIEISYSQTANEQ